MASRYNEMRTELKTLIFSGHEPKTLEFILFKAILCKYITDNRLRRHYLSYVLEPSNLSYGYVLSRIATEQFAENGQIDIAIEIASCIVSFDKMEAATAFMAIARTPMNSLDNRMEYINKLTSLALLHCPDNQRKQIIESSLSLSKQLKRVEHFERVERSSKPILAKL